MQLLSDGQITDADAKAGVGSVFSLIDPALINHYQHVAVQQSRLHIPILFAYDTIHGYRTIFPVPLGAASSFDPTSRRRRRGRRQRVRDGGPQADLQPDARRLARAPVGPHRRGRGRGPLPRIGHGVPPRQGRPGTDYSAADKVVTSRSTTSPTASPRAAATTTPPTCRSQRLRNMYLPPFKAAIDAGADTVMCSFNALNGVPGCANKLHRDRHPQEPVGLRRLHRERLHRRGRDRAPARPYAGHRPVRPRHRRGRSRRRGQRADRRHRLGDGQHEPPRLRRRSC